MYRQFSRRLSYKTWKLSILWFIGWFLTGLCLCMPTLESQCIPILLGGVLTLKTLPNPYRINKEVLSTSVFPLILNLFWNQNYSRKLVVVRWVPSGFSAQWSSKYSFSGRPKMAVLIAPVDILSQKYNPPPSLHAYQHSWMIPKFCWQMVQFLNGIWILNQNRYLNTGP